MRRVVYIVSLALMVMVVLAPGAMAQQTNYQHQNHQHMMPNGQMMDDNMMATSSATATASASGSHHHGGGGSSASAAAGGRLPSTGGVSLVSLVSVGAVALLVGFGLVAARLLRRNH